MGRLLMVESWVGATGRLLPPKIPGLWTPIRNVKDS